MQWISLAASDSKYTGREMDAYSNSNSCCRRMVMTHVDLIEKLLKYVVCYRQAKACLAGRAR